MTKKTLPKTITQERMNGMDGSRSDADEPHFRSDAPLVVIGFLSAKINRLLRAAYRRKTLFQDKVRQMRIFFKAGKE